MECKFVVGQKIVCVDDVIDDRFKTRKDIKYGNSLNGLTKGQIYTVRGVEVDPVHGFPTVFLKEIQRKITRNKVRNSEVGFHFSRFKPLKEKKTDISIFNEILNKVNDGNHDNSYNFCLDELFETVKR
jgi:hypothetical protein